MLPSNSIFLKQPYLSYSSVSTPLKKLGLLLGIMLGLLSIGLGRGEIIPSLGMEANLACINEVGTLIPRPLDNITGCFDGVECVEVRADIGEEPVLDTGYSVLYVITAGPEMAILGTGPEPFFCIEDTGRYTIHTLIYNAATLDLSSILPGQSTAGDIVNLIADHDTCAVIDLDGAIFDIEPCSPCPDGATPDPGSLRAPPIGCFDGQNPVSITAETADSPVIPEGFSFQYVLTQGEELAIIAISEIPSFSIGNTGVYAIHGLVYDTTSLDLGMVELGTTTAFDVLNLLGDTICAALDVSGARFEVQPCVEDPCKGVEEISAGTLEAIPSCLKDTDSLLEAELRAELIQAPIIPEGYTSLYILTIGNDLLIQALAAEPQFFVSEPGAYRIHTLVYDTLTLDLSFVEIGSTSAAEVLAVIGDTLCAELDVEGAFFEIEDCPQEPCEEGVIPDAGSLVVLSDSCFDGKNPLTLIATHDLLPQIPENFSSLYVLTQGSERVIVGTDSQPTFEVKGTGLYTIHTLVFDPNTLDLGGVIPGQTTAKEVLEVLADTICASLDVQGASFQIKSCIPPKDSMCLEVKDYVLTTWGADMGANFDHSLFFHHSPADPHYQMLGNRDFLQFFWETNGTYRVYFDEEGNMLDTASIFGVVYSEVDPTLKLKVDFRLIHPMTWEEHHATGGGYKANLFSTETADTAHVNWTYWEISSRSRLIGQEGLEGMVLEVSHAPINRKYKLQVGYGANDKDGSFGISGWFKYKGEYQGAVYAEQGDINVDIDTCMIKEVCVYKEPEVRHTPILQEVNLENLGKEDPRVSIVWSYFSEEASTTTFYVERAFDKHAYFETIGSFRAIANKFNYSFIDQSAKKATAYVYRIRAVEEGKEESLSEIRSLKPGPKPFKLSPNPSSSQIFISPGQPSYGAHTFQLFGLQGQLVEEKELLDILGPVEWELGSIPEGLYFLRIESPNRTAQILSFVKR